VVEDAFGKALVERQPMRGGEIDPRLPFLGAVVLQRIRRNPELHVHPPSRSRWITPRFGGLGRVDCPQDSAIRWAFG
jgi:hypothetical protein